jgi:hypothetical protein
MRNLIDQRESPQVGDRRAGTRDNPRNTDSTLHQATPTPPRRKRLFGNADRLQVAYAVAVSSGVVHAQELSDALSISPPRVRAQLLLFAESEMMHVLPRSGHTQNYERIDDAFWLVVVEYVKTLMRDPMAELGLRADAHESMVHETTDRS